MANTGQGMHSKLQYYKYLTDNVLFYSDMGACCCKLFRHRRADIVHQREDRLRYPVPCTDEEFEVPPGEDNVGLADDAAPRFPDQCTQPSGPVVYFALPRGIIGCNVTSGHVEPPRPLN